MLSQAGCHSYHLLVVIINDFKNMKWNYTDNELNSTALGHEEPWIIAMDCQPTKATVLDYGARWAIEPTFSDFKSRGFQLEDTQLQAPDRLDRLILIMTLAMYWCVRIGQDDARYNPTVIEKKPRPKLIPTIGASKKWGVACYPGSNVAYGYCSADCKPISPYRLSAVRS